MTPKQREQYFKKQQEALARINKITPVAEVTSTTLDGMFDYIAVNLGVHDLILDYEPNEDDIYDEMLTEETIQDFFRRF